MAADRTAVFPRPRRPTGRRFGCLPATPRVIYLCVFDFAHRTVPAVLYIACYAAVIRVWGIAAPGMVQFVTVGTPAIAAVCWDLTSGRASAVAVYATV